MQNLNLSRLLTDATRFRQMLIAVVLFIVHPSQTTVGDVTTTGQQFGSIRVDASGGFDDTGRPYFNDIPPNLDVPRGVVPELNLTRTANAPAPAGLAANSLGELEVNHRQVSVGSSALAGIDVILTSEARYNPDLSAFPRSDFAESDASSDVTYSFGFNVDTRTPFTLTGFGSASGGGVATLGSPGGGPIFSGGSPMFDQSSGPISASGTLFPGDYSFSARAEVKGGRDGPGAAQLNFKFEFDTPLDEVQWNTLNGAWSEASNWDSLSVPGSNQTAVFNTPDTFQVNVGGQTVERLVLGGGVTVNATLTNMDLVVSGTSLANPGVKADGGTFTLESGKLKSTHAVIGESTATNVSVTGSSTRWESQGRLTVGNGGDATLTITNSGEVIAPELRIGEATPGVVNVEKGGQVLAASAAVGFNGTGTLSITDGGLVGIDDSIGNTSDNLAGSQLSIGTGQGTGTVLISGVNSDSGDRSTLRVTNGLTNYGTENGGVANVTVDDGGLYVSAEEIVTLNTLEGESSLTVTSIHDNGTRSTYRSNQTPTSSGSFITSGNSKIDVLDGALFEDAGLSLESAGASRISGVSGTTASLVDIRNDVQIGNAGNSAKLEVTDGGQLRLGAGNDDQTFSPSTLAVGSTFSDIDGYKGELRISGVNAASGIASTVEFVNTDDALNLSGELIIGSEGSSGKLDIEGGGRLIGPSILSIDDGSIEVKGFDASSNQRSRLTMNDSGIGPLASVSNGSSLRVSDGAYVTLGVFDVGEGGLVGGTGIGFAGAIGTGNGNASTLEVLGIDSLNYGAYVGDSSSLIAAEGGHVKIGNALQVNGQAVTSSGAITLGDIDPEVGKLRIGQGGALSGTGSIVGDKENDGGVDNFAGQVRAGNSPGTLTIDGNFTQGELGTTFLEVGGILAGIDYDQILVAGDASLDGNISIDFIDGFAPSEGDVFDFFSVAGSTTVIGTVPVEVQGLEDGFEFDFGASTAGGLTLVALNDGISASGTVPEPSSLLVWLMLGACVVAANRRTRSQTRSE